MRHIARLVFPVLLFSSASVLAAAPTLTLINAGDSRMTDVAYAPSGTDRWFAMAGDAIEKGGKASIALPASACVYDFHFRFKDQVMVTVKAWNACKNPVMEIGRQESPPGPGSHPGT